MSDKHLAIFAGSALWMALLALTFIVARELGWARLRRHSVTLVILAAALAAAPLVGIVKIGMPYEKKILARLIRKTGPSLTLPSGCSIFPENNVWNTPIAGLPADPRSEGYIRSMGAGTPLHPDFGVTAGMPYSVTRGAPESDVSFTNSAESDPQPYRIPENAVIEDGSDGHVVVVDSGACRLYELFASRKTGPNRWEADSGASFDLRSNRLRPAGWTSADAAGLPIFPGLVRYEEVASGRIRHAFRFTTRNTRNGFVWPGRHRASSSNDPDLPPMGQRFRLRASFDLSPFSAESRVILTALKEYGMLLADNGGPWFLTGAPDSRWKPATISELRRVTGADFEAVDTTGMMLDPNSGEARQPGATR